jgi:hypothetical protein
MNGSTALFLDARNGRDAEVRVELTPQHLCISATDGIKLAEWPLDRLTMIERGYNSGRFVLGHIGNDISRLTIFDRDLRRALIKASPSIRADLSGGKLRRFLIWIGWIPRDS